jgi:hypothetical protein
MLDEQLTVQVECHAGYRGEQTPRAILLDGRRIELVTLLDQWLAPDHRYFKAADAAGDVYILRHDSSADRWELTMYQRADPSRR